MKRNPFLWATIILVCGSLTYLAAQPKGAGKKLEKAIALYKGGKTQQAKEIIASINEGDPDYGASRHYNALCLYEAKDYVGFYRELELPKVKGTKAPPEIHEDLEYKRIDVLFYFRKFEDIFPKIQEFKNECPASTHLSAVNEYRMAALFERGMKKAIEASNLKDPDQFSRRWTEANANLQDFLDSAASLSDANYKTVPKHILKEDLWAARIILGKEIEALEEIPIRDAAGREKLSLLRVQLYQKLQPDQTDKNLKIMSDFLEQFPKTHQRTRVEFDMADLAFHRGERLSKEAQAVERAGDTEGAAQSRTAARHYFEIGRPLQSRVAVDKDSGVEASDIRELQEGLLCSYYWEQDYGNLSTWTTYLLNNSKRGEENWLRAKVFDGAALCRQANPKLEEAAAIFDEVMSFGFKNQASHDRFIAMAARWRFNIALRAGDETKAKEIVKWMSTADCTRNIKADFLNDHRRFLIQ